MVAEHLAELAQGSLRGLGRREVAASVQFDRLHAPGREQGNRLFQRHSQAGGLDSDLQCRHRFTC